MVDLELSRQWHPTFDTLEARIVPSPAQYTDTIIDVDTQQQVTVSFVWDTTSYQSGQLLQSEGQLYAATSAMTANALGTLNSIDSNGCANGGELSAFSGSADAAWSCASQYMNGVMSSALGILDDYSNPPPPTIPATVVDLASAKARVKELLQNAQSLVTDSQSWVSAMESARVHGSILDQVATTIQARLHVNDNLRAIKQITAECNLIAAKYPGVIAPGSQNQGP